MIVKLYMLISNYAFSNVRNRLYTNIYKDIYILRAAIYAVPIFLNAHLSI